MFPQTPIMPETEIETNDAVLDAEQEKKLTREQIAHAVETETKAKLECLPKSVLMKREGWSRELIDDILGAPDSSPRGSSGYRVSFYSMLRIETAEKYLKYWDGI